MDLARTGDVDAQNYVATALECAYGVPRNVELAARWRRQANTSS